jgi:hypothetical protein
MVAFPNIQNRKGGEVGQHRRKMVKLVVGQNKGL